MSGPILQHEPNDTPLPPDLLHVQQCPHGGHVAQPAYIRVDAERVRYVEPYQCINCGLPITGGDHAGWVHIQKSRTPTGE